jgi:hypothetical protein
MNTLLRIARRIVRTSGDVLDILKSLGINHVPDKAFLEVLKKAQGAGITEQDEWTAKVVDAIHAAYAKAFPTVPLQLNNKLDISNPSNLVHEILHIVLEPEFDLNTSKTTKSLIDSFVDEELARVINAEFKTPRQENFDLAMEDLFSKMHALYKKGPKEQLDPTQVREFLDSVLANSSQHTDIVRRANNKTFGQYRSTGGIFWEICASWLENLMAVLKTNPNAMSADKEAGIKRFVLLLNKAGKELSAAFDRTQ